MGSKGLQGLGVICGSGLGFWVRVQGVGFLVWFGVYSPGAGSRF